MQPAVLKERTGTALLLLVPGALVIAVLLVALAITGATSVSDSAGHLSMQQYRRLFSDFFYLGFLWRSFRIATYCTFITFLLGYPYAYVMARASVPARLTLTLIVVVQFFTSYVVRTYALILVLGNNGIINRALLELGVVDRPVPLLYHEAGVAVGLTFVPLPFMILPIYSVLKNVRLSLEDAAASLGASRFKVFWFVIFPLSLPGVLAGVVLVFLFDLTAYIMPAMLGGGYFNMVANVIQQQAMEVLDEPFASAIAMVLLLVTAVVLYAIGALGTRRGGTGV